MPGYRIHLARPSHSVDRNRIAISSIGSWRRGRLMIEDVPLSEGIDQLRRYYSGAIVLTSSELGDRRVTGVFDVDDPRSEEHTSELQSLMRISYAVFCLKKKKTTNYK